MENRSHNTQITLDLPPGWTHFSLPPELLRSAAGSCHYDDSLLIFGGSCGWIKDEEYHLTPPHLIQYNPIKNTIKTLQIKGDIHSTMNPAMFYDKHSNEIYIMASQHTNKFDQEQVGWIIDMDSLSAHNWNGPAEAQFFTSEAWGFDNIKRVFYTFHLAGKSEKDAYQVFYGYDLYSKKWNLIDIPQEVTIRHSAGGVFIPEKRLFAIHSGYFWDNKGKPCTLHDNWFYYPDTGEWKHIPCGEQIGSSFSCLHYDKAGDRILIVRGSPNGVSSPCDSWMYLFQPVKPRGHCTGEIKGLFSLPIKLGVANLNFIFQEKLYIISGSRDNKTVEYGLSLNLKDNMGIPILG